MVGFVREPAKQDEDAVANQLKHKTSNEPGRYRFNFEGYSPDLDGLSLSSLEPFLDFDSIKDWIEEMQVPDSTNCNRAELGGERGEESHLVNPIGNCSVQGMDGLLNSGPVKVESGGTDEHTVENRDKIADTIKSVSSTVVNYVKAELGSIEPAETNDDGHLCEIKTSNGVADESGAGKLDDKDCGEMESLGCSIEEGLQKVTLVGNGGGLVIDGSGMNEIGSRKFSDKNDSESESESESESATSSSSSSSSSSASSSSSESDDDDELMVKDESCKMNRETTRQKVNAEEGEIMDTEADKMVSWTDNDDEDDNGDLSPVDFELGDDIDDDEGDLPKGPIKSKNELQVLPPVPPVNVSLQPDHQILPVGVVLSVLGTQVIVEGSEKHNPLSEGSIIWITESRLPLGIVDEIFGPVKTPYYIVRYNSESDVPSDVQNGTAIGFVAEFVGHVLNDKSLYQKGYDASNENDEEVLDEVEFSDDEKEAEHKRLLKMSKRGNNNEGQGSGNKKKNRNKGKNRENTWTKNQSSVSQAPAVQPSQPYQIQQHMGAPSPSLSQVKQSGESPSRPVFNNGSGVPALTHSNQSGAPPMGPFFPGGPSAYSQLPQQAAFMLNGYMGNGMPFQQQNMAMSGGFQMNCIPWMQQNHPQAQMMPSVAPAPWQQQQHIPQFPLGHPGPSQQPFDLSQLVAGANGSALGPMNFPTGPANSPWPGLMGPNLSSQAPFVAGLQNLNGQLPMFPGFTSNAPQPMGQSSSSQPAASFPGNVEVSSQFNQGFSSGRGRGRKPFHRRGGHFGGGRGRQQSN